VKVQTSYIAHTVVSKYHTKGKIALSNIYN